MNRITAVEKETERPVGTSTAIVPKVHSPRLDLAVLEPTDPIPKSSGQMLDPNVDCELWALSPSMYLPSNWRSQISDKNYISCMILLFLLFSDTSTMNRINVPTGRSVSFSTAVIRFIVEVSEKSKNNRIMQLNLAFAPMTLVSGLLAQAQRTQVPQRKKGNDKITFANGSRAFLIENVILSFPFFLCGTCVRCA
jgi:hypothetical protein